MASFEVFVRPEILAEGHCLVTAAAGEPPRIELKPGESWRGAVEAFLNTALGVSAPVLELKDLADAKGELLPLLELKVRCYLPRKIAVRKGKFHWVEFGKSTAGGRPGAKLDPRLAVELFTDGGSRGNPGPAGIGGLLRQTSAGYEEEYYRAIGTATNNEAEYRALIEGLKLALERGARKVRHLADSQLLVRQLEGAYKVKATELIALHAEAKALAANLEAFSSTHVPREQNTQADRLANRALDELEKTADEQG